MLGFPRLYCKSMRLMMFQLSGFYCRGFGACGLRGLGFGGLIEPINQDELLGPRP